MKQTFRHVKRTVLLLLIAVATGAQAQYQNLQYLPENISAGAKLSFSYNADGTPVAGKKDIACVLYYFSNKTFNWKGVDIPLSPEGQNKWTGEYLSPNDCAFITLKFTAGDSIDNNNNQSYGLLLMDSLHPGLNAPASRAAWGLLRSPGYGYSIEGYLDGSRSINDTVTHYWLDTELRQPFTNGKSAFAIPYAQSLYLAYGNEEQEKLTRVIEYLTRKDAPMEDLLRAWYITNKVTGQADIATTIASQINRVQPINPITKLTDYRSFLKSPNSDQQAKLAAQFLQKYPYQQRIDWFDDLNNIEYTRVQLTAVLSKIAKENFSPVDKYLDMLTFIATLTVYYKTVEVAHHRGNISDNFLYPYSAKLIKRMEEFKGNQPAEYSYLSPKEWKAKVDEALFSGPGRPIYLTHAEICNKLGRYDEALRYSQVAQTAQQYKSAELNDAYITALQKTGHLKEVNEALNKSIYENQASVGMLRLLKENYKKEHGSETGFEKHLQSLKKPATRENKNLAEQMINSPMPDFEMKDSNGKIVTLHSLKGKVVVLDFWAQWCVPCKASFPGMQLAVDRFKNDTEVAFYFVDTEEDENSNYQQVNKKYLEDHHFSFNLLFDNLKSDRKKTGEVFERVCKKFKISGIPQKILIDKQGNVRFITVGFNGSASELSDELSELIEITKKQ